MASEFARLEIYCTRVGGIRAIYAVQNNSKIMQNLGASVPEDLTPPKIRKCCRSHPLKQEIYALKLYDTVTSPAGIFSSYNFKDN